MGKRVFTAGTRTGGCIIQSGWEAMRANNMVAWDGYVSVGIDFTMDSHSHSRSRPVPSTLGIPVSLLPVQSPEFYHLLRGFQWVSHAYTRKISRIYRTLLGGSLH